MSKREYSHKHTLSSSDLLEFKSLESKVELGFEEQDEIAQKEIIDSLEITIKSNPSFFDAQLLLFNAYSMINESEKAINILNVAYQNILSLIVDDSDNWPNNMDWEITENQSIFRILIEKANEFWSNDFIGQAYGIYTNVLKMNLKDQPCNRYAYLAILEGLHFNQYRQMWFRNGQETNNFDNWFDKNTSKHRELKPWAKSA